MENTHDRARESRDQNGDLHAQEAMVRAQDTTGQRVLDVRTTTEFAATRVPGSVHIPLDQLPERLEEVRSLGCAKLVLCRSGARAEKARQLLSEHGIHDAVVIRGGIEAWTQAGGEVQRDSNRVSLERQVRIAAGSLVVLGVVLGFLLHPAGLLVALAVGAGLVFAGVTDRCGMALVLDAMPWNRTPAKTQTTGL